ncbi:MAG: hypothetical protein JSU86_18335 [Phycisphaerales bacterium]|nr:MAG: hypothetical protein JSU86_18335 [Phycisphaerales bacterium]
MNSAGLPVILSVLGVSVGSALAGAQKSGHGAHPILSGQKLVFQCRFEAEGGPRALRVALELPSPGDPRWLNQTVELPAPLPPIRIVQYLPNAVYEQEVVADSSTAAKPAVQLSIDGPKLSYRRWLVAGDSERNRLLSLIATWRYMAVTDQRERDELLTQFENELTRDPVLIISRKDGSVARKLEARPGSVHTLNDLSCTVRVQKFFPHFAFDDETKEPINKSDNLLNPAALVQVQHRGQTEQRWLFSKFPDFDRHGTWDLPYRLALDCPLERQSTDPDYAVVTVGRTAHEVWVRHDGQTTTKPIGPEQPIDITGSRYTFHIARAVPSGRFVEGFRTTEEKGGVTALQIEYAVASGENRRLWLEIGKQRVVNTAQGPIMVAFGPPQAAAPDEH